MLSTQVWPHFKSPQAQYKSVRCRCLQLIWQIYPSGVWIDPYVSEKLKAKYNLDVQSEFGSLQLEYFFTNDYDPEHFIEMAEIKSRIAALKTADIVCIMNAKIHDAIMASFV